MDIGFFKRAKPRSFEYKPRYYDPVKDELEQRRRQLGIDPADPESRLRYSIRRNWSRPNRKEQRQASVIRSIITVFVAVLILYYIFFTDLIKNILSVFLK